MEKKYIFQKIFSSRTNDIFVLLIILFQIFILVAKIDRYDFPRHFHQLGFPRHLVGISQTLVRICQTLVRICQTLVRICQTLVRICQTLVRICQTLVMISQVFCQLKFPRQQNCLQMCFKKLQNCKYYSSGSISSEKITMAHFSENLTQLCVWVVIKMANFQILQNIIKMANKSFKVRHFDKRRNITEFSKWRILIGRISGVVIKMATNFFNSKFQLQLARSSLLAICY